MPLDMEQALAQLRAQADTVTLPPPDDLRHRGDRRRRGVTLAGTVALILLVGASTVGTVMLLGSGRGVGRRCTAHHNAGATASSDEGVDRSVGRSAGLRSARRSHSGRDDSLPRRVHWRQLPR